MGQVGRARGVGTLVVGLLTMGTGCAGSLDSTRTVAPSGATASGGATTRVESNRATGALVAGVFLLTASYAPTAYVGLRSTREGDRMLAIPAAGPWIDLANRPACVPQQTPIAMPVSSCLPETLMRVALVASGAIQDLGLIVTAFGIPTYSHTVVVDERHARATPPRVSFMLVPTANGAAAVGRF